MAKTPEELAALRQQQMIREACIGELAELVVVIEKEQWKFAPQKRAVMAGIKLAIRELQGNKRPRE